MFLYFLYFYAAFCGINLPKVAHNIYKTPYNKLSQLKHQTTK